MSGMTDMDGGKGGELKGSRFRNLWYVIGMSKILTCVRRLEVWNHFFVKMQIKLTANGV